MLQLKKIIFFGFLFGFCSSIPIPNGQVGKAEVECGEDTIDIVFLTEDVFNGRVFVVGHANETDCVSRDVGRRTTSISIRKDRCGVVVIRSNDPPGLFANTRVMISFHTEFITKVDRGYEISCFYMEADKTVTVPITVNGASLQPFTESAEMPRCRYEVTDPITKEPLSVVNVGAKLLHRWICESTAPGLWCMTVHSCFIEDGSGTEFRILTDEGCAIDRFLLDNLEYGPGPLEAQKESHAVKFADKIVVNFQCSIKLDIKEGECPVPKCPSLKGQKKKLRRRSPENTTSTVSINAIDVDVRTGVNVFDSEFDLGAENLRKSTNVEKLTSFANCVPIQNLLLPGAVAASLIISLFTAAIYLYLRPNSSEFK